MAIVPVTQLGSTGIRNPALKSLLFLESPAIGAQNCSYCDDIPAQIKSSLYL